MNKTPTQPKDQQFPVILKIKHSQIPTTTVTITKKTYTQPKDQQGPVISKIKNSQILTTTAKVTNMTPTQPKDRQGPVISKIKNSNIPTTTAKVTNTTSTQPKNRQFPVISKSNTNTEKKQQKQATPPKTISNINRLSTEFGMQMITDRFGDGWHKLITIFFSGQQIAVLFGDAVT